MKSLLVQSAVLGLLAATSRGACTSDQCLSECLTEGKGYQVCLSQCCEVNDSNYMQISECHANCQQQCQEQYDCYAQCMPTCTQEGVIHHEPQYNNTNATCEAQQFPVKEEELVVVNDHNEYTSYLTCEDTCLYQTSVYKIELCQKDCALKYISDVHAAYKNQWYALHQSVYNTQAPCNDMCLAYHDTAICCQPLNKEMVMMVQKTSLQCGDSAECYQNVYENFNYTSQQSNYDTQMATCQDIWKRENRISCYMSVQSGNNLLPINDENYDKLYQQYLNNNTKHASIDLVFKNYVECMFLGDCNLEKIVEFNTNVIEVRNAAIIQLTKCDEETKNHSMCENQYFQEMAAYLMTQYLQAYASDLFDPIYGVNQTVYGKYQTCSMQCVVDSNNGDCFDECERQFLEDLYNEAESKLYLQDAQSFFQANSVMVSYTKCIMASKSTAQYNNCEKQYRNALAQSYGKQVLYSQFRDTFSLQSNGDCNNDDDDCAIQIQIEVSTNYTYDMSIQFEDTISLQSNNNDDDDTTAIPIEKQKRKFIHNHRQQMLQQQDYIRQVMTTKALMSIGEMNDKIDQLIEEEIARREELQKDHKVKLFNILRKELKHQYIQDLKEQWLTSLDLSTLNQPQCNATCATKCYDVNPNPYLAHDCVKFRCSCGKLSQSEYMNIEDLVPPINSFPEFEMYAINDRTILESSRSVNNSNCNIHCSEECLGLNIQFAAKEACLSEACSCTFNLFYQNASECSLSCANKCQYLKEFSKSQQCVSDCGCQHYHLNKPCLNQQALFSQQIAEEPMGEKMSNFRKYVFLGMFVIMMWATVLTIIRVKRNGKVMTYIERPVKTEKKKKIRDQVYTKMEEKKEEGMFEFDGTYEKVF